jgi:type IV pilus assembly protein PilM
MRSPRLPLFSREPPPLLGLDIDASSVRLVELSRQPSGRLTLEHVATQALEPGWLSEGQIERFHEVADALRGLVQRCGSPTRDVAMALPASAVMARTVVMPAGLSSREQLVQAEIEAGQFIPFPLEEVSLDVCETGQGVLSTDGVETLIVAARKDMVSDCQGLAEAAGLRTVVVDVAPFASRRAARRVIGMAAVAEEEALVALFELGSQSLGLQVLRGEAVLFERHQLLVGAPDTLAQDVTQALQFFFTSTPYNQVDQVLLAGAHAGADGPSRLPDAIAEHTGAPCGWLDPLEGMARGPACPAVLTQAPAYLCATGLALRRFHR